MVFKGKYSYQIFFNFYEFKLLCTDRAAIGFLGNIPKHSGINFRMS
jgi:hypothetical protein